MLSARSKVERTRISVFWREGKKIQVGNSDGTGGVAVFVKEELCEKVVEVRRRSQRVMTVVMVLEEEVLRIMCVWSTDCLLYTSPSPRDA